MQKINYGFNLTLHCKLQASATLCLAQGTWPLTLLFQTHCCKHRGVYSLPQVKLEPNPHIIIINLATFMHSFIQIHFTSPLKSSVAISSLARNNVCRNVYVMCDFAWCMCCRNDRHCQIYGQLLYSFCTLPGLEGWYSHSGSSWMYPFGFQMYTFIVLISSIGNQGVGLQFVWPGFPFVVHLEKLYCVCYTD